MTFISYAQNYEDVILHRALADIQRGFYVDVGAQDPVEDSVTKAFYMRGWRGINIEPVAKWHARLVEDRPHDVNLRMVAAAKPGEMTIHEVADSGLSTVDDVLAERYASEGWNVSSHVVEATTLDAILAEHATGEVHFLKIDAEGAEAEVLRGLSLDRVRPWILVVESTVPNDAAKTTHQAWEAGILARRYRFVYEDGLNRFYLAEEHADRASRFGQPPNFWDRFVRAPEWRAREEADQLRAEFGLIATGERIGELSHALQRALADLESMHRQAAVLDERLSSLSASLEVARQEGKARDVALAQARSALQERTSEAQALASRLQAHSSQLEEQASRLEEQALELREQTSQVEAHASRIDALSQMLAAEQEHAAAFGVALHVNERAREALQRQYEEILQSRSWRLTRPLRVLRRMIAYGPREVLEHARSRRGVIAASAPVLTASASLAVEPTTEPRPISPRSAAARDALDDAWHNVRTERPDAPRR